MIYPFEVVTIDNSGAAIQKILKKDNHEDVTQSGDFYALKKAVDKTFKNVVYTGYDGKLTFTFVDGSTTFVDLPLELLVDSGYYNDETQEIVLVLSNGDNINIPAGDLVDVYEADNTTIALDNTNGKKTFSVKDGVFATEAPADGALYARTNGDWKAIIEGLPEITLAEADDVYEGVYRVLEGSNVGLLCASIDIHAYDGNGAGDINTADIEGRQTTVWSNGRIENRTRFDGVVDISEVVQNEDGSYGLKPGYEFYEPWSAWQSVVPSLAGYAKTGELNTAIAGVKRDRKLKLLKTITLEEDVASLNVEFDKPVDEIAMLFNVAFLVAETKVMAARTDGGAWYMFWAGGAMKTTKQFFFVHTKEYAERHWETFASGAFFDGLQGISNSTTTPKLILSRRNDSLTRFVKDLTISIPQNTKENAFVAGSTIQIWGHEADENL